TATSLDWGVWEQRSGMTGHMTENDLARMRRQGLAPLRTDEALGLFDEVLDADETILVPVGLDRAAVARDDLQPPSGEPGGRAREQAAGDGRPLAERLPDLTAAERADVLLKLVFAEAAIVLGHVEGALTPDRTFRELGVDSLTGLELRNRLSSSTGLRLRASLTNDNPTPAALAAFLCDELSP